jgi:ectoine hydroxylase-related dioxygenase (phytanoyl-CoA dioxygenase family)
MISVMVALDRATRENGCLKVLVGSHRLGRLDHGKVGGQQGADAERLRAVEKMLDVYYWEANPGAALFFNCNTLHASEPNLSNRPRRAYICAYNAFSNVPVIGEGHGKPVPIEPAGDRGILRFRKNKRALAS